MNVNGNILYKSCFCPVKLRWWCLIICGAHDCPSFRQTQTFFMIELLIGDTWCVLNDNILSDPLQWTSPLQVYMARNQSPQHVFFDLFISLALPRLSTRLLKGVSFRLGIRLCFIFSSVQQELTSAYSPVIWSKFLSTLTLAPGTSYYGMNSAKPWGPHPWLTQNFSRDSSLIWSYVSVSVLFNAVELISWLQQPAGLQVFVQSNSLRRLPFGECSGRRVFQGGRPCAECYCVCYQVCQGYLRWTGAPDTVEGYHMRSRGQCVQRVLRVGVVHRKEWGLGCGTSGDGSLHSGMR